MATVLAIETSCDETAVAVVSDRQILSNLVASQMEIHAAWGGVVPEVAARQHVEVINQAIAAALREAFDINLDHNFNHNQRQAWQNLDGVAVTAAPGLIGALLVGVTAAKTLALLHEKPLIGVHHLEGHICSGFLADPDLQPPFLCLLVSGGHSSLILVQDYGKYQVVGKTRDDAAGEAFDKVARLLKLGYPGGPAIQAAAEGGNPRAFDLPQGKIHDAPWDFSFSGLKTAVARLVTKNLQGRDQLDLQEVRDIAASFQFTIAQTLATRAVKCAIAHNLGTLVLVGGVAANLELRSYLQTLNPQAQLKLVFPPLKLCTDNAAMIGCAGAIHLERGEISSLSLASRAKLAIEDCAMLYS
ncbi:MAG: tRNA (adenosine(37)-N6)-threonylcarbamoyltransferase complex transferase subunit TsaD [Pseudanabaenaceae cyanobacterium bins.68]|nr:tRNA (adenosine(37)-N6)-threonylcarbamoyltransferase complex transferase subunit TsaD [Pseudanabaenaceae cyanobacterium bins.68]